MNEQLKIALLNAIEYIEEITDYGFDYIAIELLGIKKELLKELKGEN
jgi:hypothetical protein